MPTPTYWKNVALKAVVNSPPEDIVYAVFTEFLTQLKTPQECFVIYPQVSLKWKPYAEQDKRGEVLDVGVGNFTFPGTSPTFKLRFGVEAKRSRNRATTDDDISISCMLRLLVEDSKWDVYVALNPIPVTHVIRLIHTTDVNCAPPPP